MWKAIRILISVRFEPSGGGSHAAIRPLRGQTPPNEAGLALILVTVIVALATMLAVNLAHSTYLSSRSLGVVARQLQAEYALKSLINAAVVLIQQDATPGVDAVKDPWGLFLDGAEIPAALIGLNEPGVQAFLEIRPTNARLRLSSLDPVGDDASPIARGRFERLRDIFARLMKVVLPEELWQVPDHLQVFNRSFSIEETVANLIDYLDQDREPYRSGDYQGIESEAYSEIFRSEGRIESVSELSRVPGFTPERLRRLAPYLDVEGELTININTAGVPLIQALHEDMTEALARAIYELARDPEEGPIENPGNLVGRLSGYTPDMDAELKSVVTTRSLNFVVIAKISYGLQGSFFAKALLQKSPGNLGLAPQVRRLVLY